MIKVNKINRVDNLIGQINNIFKEIKDAGLYNIKTKWEIELDNKITEGD